MSCLEDRICLAWNTADDGCQKASGTQFDAKNKIDTAIWSETCGREKYHFLFRGAPTCPNIANCVLQNPIKREKPSRRENSSRRDFLNE